MRKSKFILIITNLNALDGMVSYIQKEATIKESISKEDFHDFRIRFFHGMFQSKSGTLNRILREEKHKEIHVMFQRGVSTKKALKLMDRISEVSEVENIIFSSRI